jgi:hypothetical protein
MSKDERRAEISQARDEKPIKSMAFAAYPAATSRRWPDAARVTDRLPFDMTQASTAARRALPAADRPMPNGDALRCSRAARPTEQRVCGAVTPIDLDSTWCYVMP